MDYYIWAHILIHPFYIFNSSEVVVFDFWNEDKVSLTGGESFEDITAEETGAAGDYDAASRPEI